MDDIHKKVYSDSSHNGNNFQTTQLYPVEWIKNFLLIFRNEKDDMTASGALLNNTGVRLRPKFGSTGFDQDGDKVGILRTGDSRLYVISEI